MSVKKRYAIIVARIVRDGTVDEAKKKAKTKPLKAVAPFTAPATMPTVKRLGTVMAMDLVFDASTTEVDRNITP